MPADESAYLSAPEPTPEASRLSHCRRESYLAAPFFRDHSAYASCERLRRFRAIGLQVKKTQSRTHSHGRKSQRPRQQAPQPQKKPHSCSQILRGRPRLEKATCQGKALATGRAGPTTGCVCRHTWERRSKPARTSSSTPGHMRLALGVDILGAGRCRSRQGVDAARPRIGGR